MMVDLQTLKGLLLNNIAQILQNLNYKECSIILPKFTAVGLFILILGTSAIMDQIACCCVVTTLEIVYSDCLAVYRV